MKMCIHELFETQAARTPDSMAVAFGGSSLSYGALNRRADELAGQLRALGVGPDVLVALFLERSLDMVVGMLAVLKAGGAYVPLDPAHPPARLAYMLEDAQPLILLTQKRLQPDLPPHRAQLLLIDGVAPLVPAPAAGPRPEPGHLAYVIYTSGSTGQPKGVEIEHRAVVNMLAAMQQRPGLAAADRMLAITTLTFDIAVLEIFLPLVCGAGVVIAPSATAGDGVALAGLIAQSGVSVMQATPATLRMLLQAGWGGVPGLKILCGGEAYTEELAGQVLARCGTLWNMYGPTETTVWSAVAELTAGRPVTMGPPIANTRFYVLDRALQLVPVGVPGELYIGGAGLARGYRRRPDLTAARFVTDPFAAAQGGLMYRTGDLVRRLSDGTLEFLGRLDHPARNGEAYKAFFRQLLGDVDEATAPFGVVNKQGDVSGRDEACLTLEPSLAEGLRTQADRLGVTPVSLFHLAWALVVARTSAREDVLFGTLLSGRTPEGTCSDREPGLFVNTLPVRVVLHDTPLEQAVRDVHAQLTQLRRQLYAPVSLVQECSALPAPALFSALLNVRYEAGGATPEVESRLPWQGAEPRNIALTSHPCTLTVEDIGRNVTLYAQVSARIAAERICAFMRNTLENMLETLETKPGTPVYAIEMLPSAERHQLLHGWNATPAALPANEYVHELFEAQAEKTPEAIAVTFEDRQLSYAELNRRANQLAHHLIASGLRPEARVAIVLERRLELVVAMLAILKAGGAFVPIDPAYPAERLSFMIEDSTPAILLTQRSVLPVLGPLPDELAVFTLDDPAPLWATLPATNPERSSTGVTSANLAYVIYTSGSTGRPKGVLIEHGPLALHCRECQEFYELTPEDRVLQFASPSFDASIEQILPPLLSGARVVLRDAQIWTPNEFQQKLAELGLTVINLPPAFWQQLAEQWAHAAEPVSAHAVRLVIIGGDAMSVQTLRQWQQTKFNEVRLLNAYGPTETVITATSFEIPALEPGQAPLERLPIGRPRGARQIYVLDRWRQLAPVGVAGELHIGGSALARGYHNRGELTEEKFIADPFRPEVGARLYRTGDLARYLPDGNIEFLGRIDQQVKLRGFRIELGEIEVRLREYAAIREAVVLLREDAAGNKRLVAYYVALNHEPIDAKQLRSHLAASLPEYMVPASYVRLDALPLTPNGKLDRKALPAPDGEAYSSRRYEAPQGKTEILLATIWAELLKRDRVGRHDNFFELGGHSLLAVRVLSRLQNS